MLLFAIGVLWTIEVADKLFFDQQLNAYGVRPRESGVWWRALVAPFMHAGFAHLTANTIPFLILGWLTIARRIWEFFFVCLLGAAGASALAWTLGESGSVHIGASGVIFGFLGFLLTRAVFERSVVAIVLALLAAALYGGMLETMVPNKPGVSWEGHLGGFAAGILSGWLLARKQARP